MTAFQKRMASGSVAILAAMLLGGCGASEATAAAQSSASTFGTSSVQASSGTSSGEADSVAYQNEQYGFTFTLPED